MAIRKNVGYQQIGTAALASAVGLTVPDGAQSAILQAETQDIRWRDDGTNPTTSVGMNLTAGTEFLYTGELSEIKFIRVTSGAILNVSFYA